MIDKFGVYHYTSDELCTILYQDPTANINAVAVDDPEVFNDSIKSLFVDIPTLNKYQPEDISIEEFDIKNQNNWFMPDSYKNMDIAKWVLDQCKTDAELQRVGQELLLYYDRNLISVLQYMKYMVDTFRSNKVVWGVGRGSSVSSYVLYLIGVHRINSMFYDLDPTEFLK
jgi:DNA polymerase III alpha subunit